MNSYLKPRVPEHEFSNFGFRKCKGKYGRCGCYYMLVRADDKVIFASKKSSQCWIFRTTTRESTRTEDI